jgi:tetratricopeptide (TPR) repeat protein
VNQALEHISRLQGFLRVDPGNVALTCDLVDAQLSLGDVASADAVLASLRPELLAQPGIRFRRARAALIGGRYAEASGHLETLIAEGHENPALWHDLAFCQLCEHRFDDAEATLAQSAQRFGTSADALVVSARIATMRGDYTGAAALVEQALAMVPEHATALGLRALISLDRADTDAAAQQALQCLARYPNQHEALLAAGSAAMAKIDIATAESHFLPALARHPNSGRALSGQAQVLMVRNDLAGAQQMLERAVVAMPDHIGTWHLHAWASLLQGQIDKAEASYQRAYELDRNFAESHGGLALVQAITGRAQEADLGVRRALRLNPECATALYAKSILLDDAGRHDEAQALVADLMAPLGLPDGTDMGAFARSLRARISAQPA